MDTLLTSFGIAFAVSAGASVIWFVISLIDGRNDVADIGWGTYFVLIALVLFFLHHPALDLRIVPLVLVCVWAFRLSSHILRRHLKTGEDRRYLAWRTQWGNGAYFYVRSFFQVFLLQSVLAALIAAPLIVIESSLYVSVVPVVIGTLVWIFGFVIESTGDAQLKEFLSKPENKGRVMQSGLWKYSRHPNYFGEVTQWWGMFVIALGAPFGWIGIIGPVVITCLIVFVSGIPLAESGMKDNPEFKAYKARTSALVPWPRFNR